MPRIDTSSLPFAKPAKRKKRKRAGKDPNHLKNVRLLPCVFSISGDCMGPVQAHHRRRKGESGMGLKSPDKYALPLCMKHHGFLHDQEGDETRFFSSRGVDPVSVTEALWRHRGDYARMLLVIERARP